MRSLLPLLSLLTAAGTTTAAAAAAATQSQTTIAFVIPPSASIPNPHLLPPSTRATLTALHVAAAAPLSAANALVFRNVSAGSYLLDVHCATHAFAPARVDVRAPGEGAEGGWRSEAWVTYRGNDWENKGEALVRVGLGEQGGEAFEVRVLGAKGYFMERSSFSVFGILKSPMILLGLVSMGIFIGMPYLVDNMDPEMKAEWEERQKSNPVNNLLGGGATPGPNPMGNFDMAAYLAGSSSKKEEASGSGPSNGGGKKKK